MNRSWEVHGRNGNWAVDEHRTGESGVRATVFVTRRRQDAATVAYALNAAYAAGIMDSVETVLTAAGATVSRETTVPHSAGPYWPLTWSEETHRAIAGVGRVVLDHPCRFCGAEPGELHRETTVPHPDAGRPVPPCPYSGCNDPDPHIHHGPIDKAAILARRVEEL
jgi:hypothetical protein